MKKAIAKAQPTLNKLWCHSQDEFFSLRACLINLLTEPHIDNGDLDWAMLTGLGQFQEG